MADVDQKDLLKSDVLILGGGLVGLTLALALDVHGISSIVVDPANPADILAPGHDGRASAVASGPYAMLEAIGVGARLAGKGCPIRTIEVRDGLQKKPLIFASEPDEPPLGYMFENRALRMALHEQAAQAKNIRLMMQDRAVEIDRGPLGVVATLQSGVTVKSGLLIGAEGRQSPTRDAAGINTARWQYDHSAVICMVEHELSHENVAHEIFYADGPFAILPMLPGNRSCVVWTVSRDDAPALATLPEKAFLAEMHRKTGGLLGQMKLLSPRSFYPLSFHHTAKITGERLALVGDAAHGIHPIAGQGLNLGLRDAATLAEVLVDGIRLGLDAGDAQLLARYERWRALDSLMVAGATDGFVHLFGVGGKIARGVRRFGLNLVENLPPLKQSFMNEARGASGDLPKLLHGMTI